MKQVAVTNPKIGDKVVRGKDWNWGNQDKGSKYGIVVKVTPDDWCTVKWVDENGKRVDEYSYRFGHEDKYDLYYYDLSKPEKNIVVNPEIGEKVVRNPENWISDYADMGSEYGIIRTVSDNKKIVTVDWISKSGSIVRSHEEGPGLYTGHSGRFELLYYQNTSSKNNHNHGSIKVPAIKTEIRRGERSRGVAVRGRSGKTAIGVRYLGNQAVKGF